MVVGSTARRICLIAGVVMIAIGIAAQLVLNMRSKQRLEAAECQHLQRFSLQALLTDQGAWNAAFRSNDIDQSVDNRTSWRVHALDAVGWHDAKVLYSTAQSWNSETNKRLAIWLDEGAHWNRPYMCPTERRPERVFETNYFAVVRESDEDFDRKKVLLDHSSAPSTALIIEATSLGVHWMEPRDISAQSVERLHALGKMTSLHTGGVNIGYSDGSVRFVSSEVDSHVLRRMLRSSSDDRSGDK